MMSEDQPKPKTTLIERIRFWWWERNYKKARQALTIMDNKDPEIYRNLNQCAEVMARQMCMTWLDNQGLHHCAKCPNTKPLVTVQGVLMCLPHARLTNGKVEPVLSVVKA